MTRPLRIEYKGVFYHTTSRGNERRRICFAKLDYGRFKEKGRRYHCQFVLIQGLTPFFLRSDYFPPQRQKSRFASQIHRPAYSRFQQPVDEFVRKKTKCMHRCDGVWRILGMFS